WNSTANSIASGSSTNRRDNAMAKKIIATGKPARRIEVTGKPQRRIEPGELAAALGAEPVGEYLGANLDPITLGELGTQLLNRLRSTGGRPALSDASEICRVPLSPADVQALEKITEQVQRTTGAKPSPGQVASVIVRNYLTTDETQLPINAIQHRPAGGCFF